LISNRLKPTNDFIFKKIFGENDVKENLISLLNAILKLEGEKKLKDIIIIENKELLKELITDKTGRLDVRAETLDNIQIDIEIQLIDQRNIVERMLYYLSKMYSESIKAGGKYKDLKKTIVIGILDFDYFEISKFHSTYHFYEDEFKDFMLTDKFELNFVEMPKFRKASKDIKNPLHRWLLFLENDIPKEMLKEVVEMDPIIRKAEERLEWLSSDEETIKLYKAREEALIERMSLIDEGEERAKKEIAKNLLDVLDVETISAKTGLSIEEIEKLKQDII
jgi:predicted transposase/invertase (TIGR01784 family)